MAGWVAEDLDLIIGACGVMEQPIPGTACLIQRRLGLGGSGIPAFDVNAICLSFLVALEVVSLGMAARRWRRALIVSADIASAGLDFDDPEASVIFGDGAAAVAVEAGDNGSAILGYRLETYGDGATLCQLEAGGTRLRPEADLDAFLAGGRFRMDGPGVFKATARRFPAFTAKLLETCGVALPGAGERVVDIFADHGNQIAASLPSALHAAIASGRLQRGDLALLVGTAAGVSLGGAVIRY